MKKFPPIELINTSLLAECASLSVALQYSVSISWACQHIHLSFPPEGTERGGSTCKLLPSRHQPSATNRRESKYKCLNVLTSWGDTSEEHAISCTRGWTPISHKGNLLINTLHIDFLFFLNFLPPLLVLQGSLTKSMARIQSVSQRLLLWESIWGQCNKCFIKQWVTLRQCLVGIFQPSNQQQALWSSSSGSWRLSTFTHYLI